MASFLSQIAKITDHLYLSSFVGATESNVSKLGITCVITVCKEVPKVNLKQIESIKLDVVDRPNESLIKYFDFLADKIKDIGDRNGTVLVHCVAGVSRSATIVLAYLMKHCKMMLRDAHDYVKSKRPFIRPNLGFWKQLVDYEMRIFGKNSVKIVSSNIGYIPDLYENEVKNMTWVTTKNSSFGLSTAFANLSFTSSSSRQSSKENGALSKEKSSSTTSAFSNNKSALKPIITSALPKQSSNNSDNLAANKSDYSGGTETTTSNKASSSNAQYTTTYRTSFQKPN